MLYLDPITCKAMMTKKNASLQVLCASMKMVDCQTDLVDSYVYPASNLSTPYPVLGAITIIDIETHFCSSASRTTKIALSIPINQVDVPGAPISRRKIGSAARRELSKLHLFRTSPLDLANLINRPFMTLRALTDPHDDNAEPLDAPVTNAAPELSILTPPATADFKVIMTRPNAYNVHHSVFPYRANSIAWPTKSSNDITENTNQKRKHYTADLADAETATKRTRPMLTEHASPGSEVVGSFFTPINVPMTTQNTPTVTGHPYAPIAPKPEPIGQVSAPATSGLATTEHLHSALMENPQDSIAPGIAGYVSAAVTVPVMMRDLSKSRLAPAGSIE